MILGNTIAQIKTKSTTPNEIGGSTISWNTIQTIKGWLDLQGGNAQYTNFNAKIQESTHVFVADFVTLDPSISSENSRMVVNGLSYDILLIDDPMELHKQLEFYLKYTGGQ